MKNKARPQRTDQLRVVPLSCPDCSGVLRMNREGRHKHVVYRCQVDHRYTPNSLLEAKEKQVERVLWSAVVLLKQLDEAYGHMLKDMPAEADRQSLQRRVQEAARQCLAIRAMIESTHAP
ncbi:MAG: hypothetical protein A4E19_05425 [Nitrospira sp. SG-bin1]|nr:MAG: hypothetical protein A4E19_05425 [Nitrospira sp. SG-bin1]